MSENHKANYVAYWMTLDPIHVGSGGYRLGRVDLPIVKEPGTNLPKIPGTSLSGAARAYAAVLKHEGPPESLGCAGQRNHCGECQVCATFGSVAVDEHHRQTARAGMANVFDAHLLFFPVFSMAGPVWVTTSAILKAAGLGEVDAPAEKETVRFTGAASERPLNLGWLLFQSTPLAAPAGLEDERYKAIAGRIVVVHEAVFPHVVNSNLEVRTSVSIDPTTGAAKEGALFTYEAIPRAAWLYGPVVFHHYRQFPKKNKESRKIWPGPADVVRDGFKMMEVYGVGGMGTRGFGRLALVSLAPEGGAA